MERGKDSIDPRKLGMLPARFLRYSQSGVAHGAETHGKGKDKTIYAMDIGVEVEGTALYVERKLFLNSPNPRDGFSRLLIESISPHSLDTELVVGRPAATAYSEFRKSLVPNGPRKPTYGPTTVYVPDYFITWARHMDAARRLSTQVAMHLAGIDFLTRSKGKDLRAPAQPA